MADDERNLPPGVQDVLAHLPREMRRRVLADYETHYSPFLSLLAGWKGAVQEHYLQSEAASVARLEEQFFPLGDWHFPAQALAVPQRPVPRTVEIGFGMALTDSANNPWIVGGDGWLQPTALQGLTVQQAGPDCLVSLDIDYLATGPIDPMLKRGQLVFAAAPEDAVEALERGVWWVWTPGGGRPRPLRVARYDGYLQFERDIQTARLSQRQLDLWLPPFYPYSRKILCFSLGEGAAPPPPEIERLGRDLKSGFRCAGLLAAPAARPAAALRTMSVFLNAVPAVQTALSDTVVFPPFPRVGQDHALRLPGVPRLFAASVRQDERPVPSSLIRLPSPDPLAAEPDVQVQFPQAGAGVTAVRLYYGSLGAEAAGTLDLPAALEKAPLRFTAPFPLAGGVSVGSPATRLEWTRTAWYQSVLRPPLLSEGDLVEIIRQRQKSLGLGSLEALRFRSAARRIVHEANFGGAHWRSYLWPSLLARAEAFGAGGELPAPDSMPLIQSLILTFERVAGANIPDFLVSDMAHYLASVLSQYFVLSTFQIEGRVL
jgi:hypothetical protein